MDTRVVAVDSAKDVFEVAWATTAGHVEGREWLDAIDLVLSRPPVLSRASEPMPMSIGTLDAIHLATALIWRDRLGPLPEMATHDTALGAAARTFGFNVRGT